MTAQPDDGATVTEAEVKAVETYLRHMPQRRWASKRVMAEHLVKIVKTAEPPCVWVDMGDFYDTKCEAIKECVAAYCSNCGRRVETSDRKVG